MMLRTVVVLTCEDAPVYPNISVGYSEEPYFPGTKATYQCSIGYKLDSNISHTIICEVNEDKAEWTINTSPQCVRGNGYVRVCAIK